MVQYILRPAWMKKIQLGICPDSIHPENGRAVFVYCDSLAQPGITGKLALKPKYAIEFGSFFPHIKAEISSGVFAVSEGHTDQLSFYGDDMFPDCFQSSEDVLVYSKKKVLELEKQLSETPATVNNGFKITPGASYISIKIALAAWRLFVEQFEKALQENRVDSFAYKTQE
ncbi:MAG: hypothetical protein ABI707_08860 [Ferruginibacter sp.]